MEIQNGEYIRTNDGYMGKVTRFTTSDICYVKFYDNEEWKTDIEEAGIVKHSFNIIDLIEKSDFVKLEYYVAKYKKRITRFFEISKIDGWQFVGFENEHCHFTYDLEKNRWLDGKGYNPKIKSIVTKEQIEAMEYEVK